MPMRTVLFAVLCAALTGCLLHVESDVRPTRTGWSEEDVARLEVGRSDREWVRGTFGDPSAVIAGDGGAEVWEYRNRSERDTEVGLFLIFSVDVESERVETLSIEFTDGVVSGYRTRESSR